VEIGVGVKLTRAQVGIAGVVGASSWTNAKFMAVSVDKDAVSRTHEDGGVEDVVSVAWTGKRRGCRRWRRVSCGFQTVTNMSSRDASTARV
jgi:hypothetical protein